MTSADLALDAMRIGSDPHDSPAQQLNRLWHVVLALGHEAEPARA